MSIAGSLHSPVNWYGPPGYRNFEVTYFNSCPRDLLNISIESEGQYDIIDRTFAASGLVRALTDVPPAQRTTEHTGLLETVSRVLLNIRLEHFDESPQFAIDELSIEALAAYIRTLGPINGHIAANRYNLTASNYDELASIINESSKRKLLIPMGHSGVVAGADLFIKTGDLQKNKFHPVRFSNGQYRDEYPLLGDEEASNIRVLAESHEIVLTDWCRSTGNTMCKAGDYFARLTGRTIRALTPLDYNRSCFDPLVTEHGPVIKNI